MTRQSALRRTGLFLLACVLAAVLAVPVLAAGIPDAPDAYVYDEAGVLSDSTEQYINLETAALDEACGGQIAVVAVEFTGAYSTADYAYELFNAWGIGDRNENNGLLLLLVTGAEDYYIMPGSGVTDIFSGGTLQTLMDDYLEADFAAGNYDAGVRKTFDRIMEIYGEKYDLTPTSASDAGYSGYADAEDSLFSRFFRVIGKILTFPDVSLKLPVLFFIQLQIFFQTVQLLHTGAKHLCDAVGQQQGRVVLPLFQRDNRPRRDVHQLCQLLLGHFVRGAQLLYQIFQSIAPS